MDRFDILDAFLGEIKDRPFTIYGKPEQYTVRNFAGIGHHLENDKGELIALVDDFDSTPDMLVFSTSWLGKRMTQKVSIDAIEFVGARTEVAA